MEARSTDVQNNFGTYLKLTQFEDIFITRNGRKVAVLTAYNDQQVCEGSPSYTVRPKVTLEEFFTLRKESDQRYEFIDGEIVLQASPNAEHQRATFRIAKELDAWAKNGACETFIAPFDITVQTASHTSILQPDVILICDLENIDEQGRYHGTPTIVVEVLSENTQSNDLIKKLDVYRQGGIREYWIANPSKQEILAYTFEEGEIKEYRLFRKGETLTATTDPELVVRLSEIFG